jgi:hypothetical protein
MLHCFFSSCYDEPINTYYYATYKRAFLDLKSSTNEQINNGQLFYQKDIYCAHLYPSTYDKFVDTCDVLHNELSTNSVSLYKNETIEDINITNIVVLNKYPSVSEHNEEIDAYTYIQNNAISYEWKGNSGVMWTKWCDNIPLLNQI